MPTPADFFRFMGHKLRQALLDLVEQHEKRAREQPLPISAGDTTTGYSTNDPVRLAVWTEMHDRLKAIPEDQHVVFALRYYLGMTNKEIAEGLGWHEKKVSRLWVAATEAIADFLPTDLGR